MKEARLTTEQQTRERLNFASAALGKAILNSEPYQNFIKERDNFRVSDDAKKASMEYNTVLLDYQMKANYGGLTQDDEVKSDEARKKAKENIVLNDFYTSQETLISFYQELNSY